MYLKSIDLHGFKSFANKTTITFVPPTKDKHSVTAIVGPNGSGKSNISDAIRWVMGEQSMKQLRGKKSADIIFAGSEAKGQMSTASVSLTIDNSDGRADVDYEELVLTRRLYRTGESEYLINGNSVRLMDVQLLLAKAQFGQGAYGIIGQGMIDRLVLQSNEERKAFFDEAAGIKEFQIKRRHAWLKLVKSKEHLEQADALLHEIAPRLKSLSRQVKKLEQRQTVERELRCAQESYYATVWTQTDTQLTSFTAELDTVTTAYTKTNEQLVGIQNELAVLAKAASRQDVFAAMQQEYQQIARKKGTLERDRAVLQGKLQTEYSKAGKQNVTWLQNKIDDLLAQEATRDAEISKHETEITTLREQLQREQQRADEQQIAKTQLRGRIHNLGQQAIESRSEESLMHMTGMKAVHAILAQRHELGRIY